MDCFILPPSPDWAGKALVPSLPRPRWTPRSPADKNGKQYRMVMKSAAQEPEAQAAAYDTRTEQCEHLVRQQTRYTNKYAQTNIIHHYRSHAACMVSPLFLLSLMLLCQRCLVSLQKENLYDISLSIPCPYPHCARSLLSPTLPLSRSMSTSLRPLPASSAIDRCPPLPGIPLTPRPPPCPPLTVSHHWRPSGPAVIGRLLLRIKLLLRSRLPAQDLLEEERLLLLLLPLAPTLTPLRANTNASSSALLPKLLLLLTVELDLSLIDLSPIDFSLFDLSPIDLSLADLELNLSLLFYSEYIIFFVLNVCQSYRRCGF